MSEGCRRSLVVDVVSLAILALGLAYVSSLVGGGADAGREGWQAPTVDREQASRPRPSCFAGGVALGRKAGAIDYWARCRPTAASGDVGLTVTRTTPDEQRFLPVKAFRRFPLLKGAGKARRGRCVRVRRSRGGQINCNAKIKRAATLRGRIWVAAKERCESGIQLVSSPSSEPCEGVCASVLPGVTVIASGPPRGC